MLTGAGDGPACRALRQRSSSVVRWRSFAHLGLAVGALFGAYFLVWMPCLGSLLALAAGAFVVAAVVSGARARGAARRASAPAAVETTGLVVSAATGPVLLLVALGCVLLNGAVTAVSVAATLAPAAAAALLPHSPGHSAGHADDDRADAVSFWNGGYAGDWVPTDVGPGEDESDVQRTLRVGFPFVVLAAFAVIAILHGDEDGAPSPDADVPDATAAPDAGS